MGLIDPDNYKCPHTAFKKKCVDLRAWCPKWVHIMGLDPNTGDPVDCFDCSDQWTPTLTLEVAKEVRQSAAAVESFRNEMVKGAQLLLRRTEVPEAPHLINMEEVPCLQTTTT